MKFVCDRCKTRYSIGDDRVRGKILKIRCKNCANVITVREGMDADAAGDEDAASGRVARPTTMSPPAAQAMPAAKPPAALEEEWYVSIEGEQSGPFSLAEAQQWIAGKPADAELHCWSEGFDDWLPVDKVSHFRGVRKKAAPPPTPPKRPPTRQVPVLEPEPKPLFAATMASLERGPNGARHTPASGVPAPRANGASSGPAASAKGTATNSAISARAPSATAPDGDRLRTEPGVPGFDTHAEPERADTHDAPTSVGGAAFDEPQRAPRYPVAAPASASAPVAARAPQQSGPVAARPALPAALPAPVRSHTPSSAPTPFAAPASASRPTPFAAPASAPTPFAAPGSAPTPFAAPGSAPTPFAAPGSAPTPFAASASAPASAPMRAPAPYVPPPTPLFPSTPVAPVASAAPFADDDSAADKSDEDGLEIGEVSRVVNLADLMRSPPKERAQTQPGIVPRRVPGNGVGRTGMMAKVDLNGAPGAALTPANPLAALPPVLSPDAIGDAAAIVPPPPAPRPQRSLVALLAVAVVLLIGIGAVVVVVLSNSDEDQVELGLGPTDQIDTTRPDEQVHHNPFVPPTIPGVTNNGGPHSGGTNIHHPSSGTSGTGANAGNNGNGNNGKVESDPLGPTTALKAEEVEDMSAKQSTGASRCWERALRKQPYLEKDIKKVGVTITVDALGGVTNVSIAGMPSDDGNLGTCLQSFIHSWKFRQSSAGITAKFSMVFQNG
jgi:predicted Zn finger-like uncharacterized protein